MSDVPGSEVTTPSFHSLRLVRSGGQVHAVRPRGFTSPKAARASARALAKNGLGALVVKLFLDADGRDQICVVASFGPGFGAVPALH